MALLLQGATVRNGATERLKKRIEDLTAKPHLVIIQIGDRDDSAAYIAAKKRFGDKIGARVTHVKFAQDVLQEEIIKKILEYNGDTSVHGIIVQVPLPEHLNKDGVIDAIDPTKDVDGLTAVNLKRLWENKPGAVVPATTRGIAELLRFYNIPVEGKRVVVLGRSSLVGKPTALYFTHRNATVTVCHSHTLNLLEETKKADIIIVATGKPGLITRDHVLPHQTVIDVGINTVQGKLEEEIEGKKIVGDVDFLGVEKIVSAITPVPGGVGVMTVLSLFENLLDAYETQHAI
jgi:methylenetetrahydrofolate dehydrogenase (NADP+) / methenyltetrahydrofolate cyclohydrolase